MCSVYAAHRNVAFNTRIYQKNSGSSRKKYAVAPFSYHCSVIFKYIVQDVRYLRPHVEEVYKEDLERAKWDNIEVQRKR